MGIRRKVVFALALCAGLSATAYGQSLEQKKQAKLKKGFVKHIDWVLDYDEAKEMSADTGKPIFVYFTRSYAP